MFIEPPIPPAPPPRPPIDLTPRDPRKTPREPYDWDKDLRGPLGGKTARQFLMDLCERKFSRGTCKKIVNRAVSLGCRGIEGLIESVGGSLTAAQKEELLRQCTARADKPL